MVCTAPFLATASNLVCCPFTVIELFKSGSLGFLPSAGLPGGTSSVLSGVHWISGSGKLSDDEL